MGTRHEGLKFLGTYLVNKVKKFTAVSKIFPPGVPPQPMQWCWWHDLPLDKIANAEELDIHLLCRKRNGKGFHYLRVPVSFFKRKLKLLCVVKAAPKNREVIRLHLSAEKRDLFHDLLGDGRVDFSEFQEC